MSFTLRPYQDDAVERVLWSRKLDGNDVCALPTGSGKSVVIAECANRTNHEQLILQPTKEILEQNVSKMRQYVPASDIGIFSASCNSKRISKYTFATIGSIYKQADRFKHFELVHVDEAHLVNQKRTTGMYASFFKAIGKPKCIGYTATPYRNVTLTRECEWNKSKLTSFVTLQLINRIYPRFWNRMLVNVNNCDLVDQGFLSALKYEDVHLLSQREMKLNKSETDFDLTAFVEKLGSREEQMIDRIVEAQKDFKSVLVFCSSVRQAQRFSERVADSYWVSAETDAKSRAAIIHAFKSHTIKTVFNVGVLTTGFDHPGLDCIVLIRPTRSLALYYQMCGRGVRIAPGKQFCTVIDFSNTVRQLGRIETIKIIKDDETGWDVETETGRWHNAPLYNFSFDKKPKRQIQVIKAAQIAPSLNLQ